MNFIKIHIFSVFKTKIFIQSSRNGHKSSLFIWSFIISCVQGQLTCPAQFLVTRVTGQPLVLKTDGRTVTDVDVDGTMLDVEATFRYLGDMLCHGGDCDRAIAAKCWEMTRQLSPSICSKVYEACVCSAMLHSSETWGPNNPELQRPCHNDPAMICWICDTKDRDETVYTLSPTTGVYTKFSGRLSEELLSWLIQKFPCILIFNTGQPGCQLNLSEGQIRLDLTSGRPLV